MGYNMYEINASVAQLVEQSAFNRLVLGSSPSGGIMSSINLLPWMIVDHLDGTKKVFFMAKMKHYDLSSPELVDAVAIKIDECQQEIAVWEQLLQHQKEWINAKASD